MSAVVEFTDEQRDEWEALSKQAHAMRTEFKAAEEDAGSWLIYAIEHPESEEFAREQADTKAREAIHLRQQWELAHEMASETAYGTHLRTRVAAMISRKKVSA